MVKTSSVIGFAVALMLMASSAVAMSMPTPISGRVVNDGYLGDYSVKITNLDSRNLDSVTLTTDINGWFSTDWGNLGFTDFTTGDIFRIEVGGITKEIALIDKIDDREGAVFDLRGIVAPKEKVCPVVTCPDPMVCPEPEVPSQATCDILYPKTCPDCPTCPVSTDPTVPMVVALIAGLGAGVGVVYVKLGKTAQHMHKGIVSYHSIYTSHSDKDIRHPRGELAPKYIQINGKWKYQGA
jgi:hypothetical protein